MMIRAAGCHLPDSIPAMEAMKVEETVRMATIIE